MCSHQTRFLGSKYLKNALVAGAWRQMYFLVYVFGVQETFPVVASVVLPRWGKANHAPQTP